MKNNLRLFIFLSIFFCNSFRTFAQVYSTSADISDIKEEIRQVMAVFINYLNQVGSTKTFQTENAKKLLGIVGNYFVSTATVEVSFLDKNGNIKLHQYPYKKYLYEIVPRYPEKFAYVEIEAYPYSIDSLKLKPIIENNKIVGYEGDVKYKQIWRMKRDPQKIQIQTEVPLQITDYDEIDKDIKATHLVIKKLDTTSGSTWKVKIGNIKVVETQISTKK